MSVKRKVKFSVIPDIIFTGTTIDYGGFDEDGNRGEKSIRSVRLIPDKPLTISVAEDKNIGEEIRNILRDQVKDALQVGMDMDIGILVNNPNSPPIVIKKPNDWEGNVEVQDAFTKQYVKATFNIIKRDGKTINNPQKFGLERVFYLSAPQLNTEIDFYNHNDDSLSCGYDYIVNQFGNKNGLKKIAKNKQAIDKAINNPTKEAQLIYKEWEKEYWDEFNTEEEDYNPLPEYIDTNDIEDREWYKINCVDLSKETYKNKEIEDSLCVLDIVKWCIMGKVRLNVIDHDNNYYLTYNPQQYKDKYSKSIRTNINISLIVKYNHAYFITDEKLKTSLSLRDTNYKLDLDGLNAIRGNGKVEEKIKKKKMTIKELQKRWEKGLGESSEEEEEEKEDYVRITIAEQDYIINSIKKPPPTPEKLVEYSNGKKTTNYYVDECRLNGLVDYLYRYYKLTPDRISNINRTTIDKVVYKNLNVYSSKKRPPNLEYLDNNRTDFYNDYGKLINLYPNLNKAYIPSDTEIANEIYDSVATEDILSMFNSNTRKLFFNNEIKPDNRKINKTQYNDYPIISFDFKRAYTTALKTNEFNYCVFDAICHPVKYRGNFRPDRYYIAKNLDINLRGGYGKRMLYHGVFLQYLLDKVEIQSVIHPRKEIPKDYFNKFLERIIELEELGLLENIAKPKSLVNNFIGALKKKDGINEYTSWLINNKETAMRELMKGNVPIKLKDECGWRNECMMTSKAKHVIHFQSAQPIRLQIMETINAQNLKLIKHYKTCLYSMKFIHNYQDDIKQRKILKKIRNKKSTIPKNKKFKEIDYIPTIYGFKTDAVYVKSPFKSQLVKKKQIVDFKEVEKREWLKSESMYNFINYVVDTFNKDNDWTIVNENIMEGYEYDECIRKFKPQIPIVLGKNKWHTDIDIKHKWDKNIGGKLLLNHAIYNGGCWIDGLGGRGKSELIIRLDELVAKNKIKYRWIKAFYKITKPNKYIDLCEEWRNRNPVYYEKFAPTNIATNRIEGKTLHKGLGIPVITDEEKLEEDEEQPEDDIEYKSYINSILKRLEGDGKKPCYDVLVFDELSMIGGYLLSILSYIKTRIPRIKFILMGDLEHQLKPVGEENRNFINSLAIKELSNYNKLTLHYNFRTGKTIDELYEKCRDNPQGLVHYGEPTIRNLCYTHKKRKEIIDYHQNNIDNPILDIETKDTKTGHNNRFVLEVGTPIIARRSNKEKEIFKNEIYYFDGLVEDKIQIHNDRNEVELEDKEQLVRLFCSGYCITIHKSQSQTFRDDYTIHEWTYISQRTDNFLRLRYTAMSRSDDYENKVFMK
tara:strand:- start:496 stop:4434 length:3939 start_codon:yes stop_codon:yes gene_type:complete